VEPTASCWLTVGKTTSSAGPSLKLGTVVSRKTTRFIGQGVRLSLTSTNAPARGSGLGPSKPDGRVRFAVGAPYPRRRIASPSLRRKVRWFDSTRGCHAPSVSRLGTLAFQAGRRGSTPLRSTNAGKVSTASHVRLPSWKTRFNSGYPLHLHLADRASAQPGVIGQDCSAHHRVSVRGERRPPQ
jgi:hypothetical protein